MSDHRAAVVKALLDEGGSPGASLHSWRCEYPDRYGPCDCLEQTADFIIETLRAVGFGDLSSSTDPCPHDQLEGTIAGLAQICVRCGEVPDSAGALGAGSTQP